MTDQQTGWAFVGAQIVLLLALVFFPSGSLWDGGIVLDVIVWVLRVVGFVIMLGGAFNLGSSLTPTPMPVETGDLKTGGLYGLMRHPIYTGVLTIVAAIVIGSGSGAKVALGLLAVGFFTVKAQWEEHKLAERFPEYSAYAAVVPRFLPNPRRL